MIHFVGAGPGATDLITLRGAKLISEAGMIIYAGSLVNPELLKGAREDCEIFNSASMTLDEIVEKMADAHHRGLEIVRLHTGDPSLYGATREQMNKLREMKIPFDVTPGVSSFCAAAAALEAEYTVPGITQTVIISRMAGRTPVPPSENLSSLAAHGASMVLFLSSGLIESACDALMTGGNTASGMSGGYPPETPAAVVYKASWPEGKILRAPLGEIARMAEKEKISDTALILVGNFLSAEQEAERADRSGTNSEQKGEASRLYDPEFSHSFRAARKNLNKK